MAYAAVRITLAKFQQLLNDAGAPNAQVDNMPDEFDIVICTPESNGTPHHSLALEDDGVIAVAITVAPQDYDNGQKNLLKEEPPGNPEHTLKNLAKSFGFPLPSEVFAQEEDMLKCPVTSNCGRTMANAILMAAPLVEELKKSGGSALQGARQDVVDSTWALCRLYFYG